ncbi:hypothetical protein [Siphonobacter sp. SORGH_AS_1065]|uniref:hypothetical protein n=1 Tax=Siphonobacter sp. SORGH_AS_1065 TaxID=3041795 RepID=UPI00278494EA|nr:hypothetical protein [Siphonobacter sp. SORGH_AS_1065]MDQ1087178.1 hypothetical protein [Siphonobacter sp. SORGH_AS_1065]
MARKTTPAPKSEETRATLTARKKENMLNALEKTMGVVAPACKRLQMHRRTHYRWCEEDPEYKEKVDSIKDLALDFVESKLLKRISENSDTMIMYYLNNHGASRGYGNKPVNPNTEPEIVVRIIREERKRDE